MFETVDQAETSEEVPRSTGVWGVFCCGLLFYVSSFCLPAIFVGKTSDCSSCGALYLGWQCALIALTSPFTFTVGSVNPLVFAFIGLFFADRVPRFRAFLAAAIVPCLLLSVIFTGQGELHVGFYAWLAGILLMIGPDLCKVIARVVTFIINWG
jgi:hypothetical protein